MKWEQLQEMHQAGFMIGSHTVHHIDGAAEAKEVVRDQLIRSRADLQQELGMQQVVFSYPYDGKQHMTPDCL